MTRAAAKALLAPLDEASTPRSQDNYYLLATSRVTTPRTMAAVTSVPSSRPNRTASSTAV